MGTAPPPTDAVLVERLRTRDRSAWEELYDEHGPRLRAFAYRLSGSPHDADDLVQETFVRALPRLDRLDPETVEVGPYLFTTLRNLFLKSVERGQRAEPVAEVPEPLAPAPIEDDPERTTLLHDQQDDVRRANARLAPRQRLVLALRELEDKSYAEIGEVVGLNENAVAQLISRARESLRTELRLAQVDPARLPEECRTYLPLLSRHLDGQLRGAKLAETLAHLERCERCQDALESMREAQRRYRTVVLPFGDSEKLRERIDVELTAAGYWAGAGAAGRPLLDVRTVAAAILLLLSLGGGGLGAAVVLGGGAPAAPAAALSTDAITRSAHTTVAATSAVARTTEAEASIPQPVVSSEAATTVQAPKPKPKPAPAATTPPPTTTAAPAATTAPPSGPKTTPKPAAPKPAAPAPPPMPKPPPVATTTSPPRDTVPPSVTLLARPPAQTASTNARFAFRASESGSTFSCRLDGAPFAPCTSPHQFEGLPLGEHAFAVRARDPSGNVGPPVTARWTIVPPPDTTPPTVTIVSASTPGSDATFEFTASEPSSFACSLDGGAFESCTSPHGFSGLAPGQHTFAVRATDAAGNTSEPATHSWTVAPPLPDLVISALTRNSFTVTNVGTAPAGAFIVTVTGISTPFTFGGLAPGQSATRTWSTCRAGTITAVADRTNLVAESDETNNARSVVVTC